MVFSFSENVKDAKIQNKAALDQFEWEVALIPATLRATTFTEREQRGLLHGLVVTARRSRVAFCLWWTVREGVL